MSFAAAVKSGAGGDGDGWQKVGGLKGKLSGSGGAGPGIGVRGGAGGSGMTADNSETGNLEKKEM